MSILLKILWNETGNKIGHAEEKPQHLGAGVSPQSYENAAPKGGIAQAANSGLLPLWPNGPCHGTRS